MLIHLKREIMKVQIGNENNEINIKKRKVY